MPSKITHGDYERTGYGPLAQLAWNVVDAMLEHGQAGYMTVLICHKSFDSLDAQPARFGLVPTTCQPATWWLGERPDTVAVQVGPDGELLDARSTDATFHA